MAVVIVVAVVLLLVAFWLLFMALARDNRVFTRQPSEFELAARRFNESMVQVQFAFADALTPALRRATEAINGWNRYWAGEISEFEAKHGPRPEGVPFLDWAAEVESNTDTSRDS